jgi:asparagine synthase (glutamine-hydrolysing)
MCGFAGFLTPHRTRDDENILKLLSRMVEAIRHRGPDSEGYWHDADSGIALGHRRLAIVDLSPEGAQPMQSACGRYVLAFNGEVYNHLDLRGLLGYPSWRGHSDTESLLAGFSAWGISATLERCIGMFAFAVWDKQERTLSLARDRLGEKPLYYGWQGHGESKSFLFGSDLAALKAHPAFAGDINRDALSLYMRRSVVGGTNSIYQGIYKLEPACLLTISLSSCEPKLVPYWSLVEVAEQGVIHPFDGTNREAVDILESLLMDAVRRQMIADVPLGAFLSGGIDSSTIVALMQCQSSRSIKTFTIGFNEEAYNEAVYARAVARHLGTDHHQLYVTPQQVLEVIPKLPALYSEPFADSSQIPTFLVSQLARQHVSVSLSGDAGDELFGGYNRYMYTQRLWKWIGLAPLSVRRLAAAGICRLSPSHWNALLRLLQPLIHTSHPQVGLGDKLHKAAGVLASPSVTALYEGLVTHWPSDGLVLVAQNTTSYLSDETLPLTGLNEVQRMMLFDAITYLPDDILVKVDRAAMGVSLETRAPFLDHRVVEFAWQLPQHLKLRDGVGKWALRQVLYRHVPKALIERPKMGFGVPIDNWLRGPLREWAEDLLSESRLRQEGYFNPAPIRQKWSEHLGGQRNWQYHLWDVLIFQSWLAQQKSSVHTRQA